MSKGWVISSVVGMAVLAGVAASSGCSGAVGSSGGGTSSSSGGGSSGGTGACASPPAVENSVPPTGPQQCSSCSSGNSCSAAEPLDACCVWVAQSHDSLADGTGLHRYSTSDTGAKPDLSCLGSPGSLGTPQTVTLTGYVWLFSSGVDSSNVQVDVFKENHPDAPDGSIDTTSLGTYKTSTSDPVDPADTTWNSKCPDGCSYRQYTIPNVPTETPLVIRTSDGGGQQWATLYDYNVYFKNSDVQNGQVTYLATAVAGPDLNTVAGTVGLTIQNGMGLLAGEVHDCSDIRLFGATVESSATHQGPMFYFTEDEGNPLPSLETGDTSHLGLFGAMNLQPGVPIRVSATGKDPANPGSFLMLGTYVVQVYPGAVTAISLRGRRPWQP
ncbi:MAG: hypothetical protein ACRELB_06005 [Polyangiaceae bacterium]